MSDKKKYWSWLVDDQNQSPEVKVVQGQSFSFSWGDGVVDDYVGTGDWQQITHTYSSPGTYGVQFIIEPEDLIAFYCWEDGMYAQLPKLSDYINLDYIAISWQPGVTGPIPKLKKNNSLRIFSLKRTDLSGAVPELPSSIEVLDIEDTFLSGKLPSFDNTPVLEAIVASECEFTEVPSLTGASSLVFVHLQNNYIDVYSPSTLASGIYEFRMDNNELDLQSVDQILADFTTNASYRPAVGLLDVSGGINAVPTSTVKAACIAALPGWTINTN